MGCGEGLAKILLVVANLAFVLVGIALLAIGVVGRLKIDDVSDAIPDTISTTGTFNFLIAIGVIIFFIAFLGCCGSCKNNVCMINTYGSILIVIFLAQVALGIYAFVQIKDTNQLKTQITKQVTDLVENHPKSMETIQQTMECCGSTGPSDYSSPPSSCYKDQNDPNSIFKDGCAEKISTLLVDSVRILAIVVISVSAVEVFGAVLAFGLSSCIKDRRRTY